MSIEGIVANNLPSGSFDNAISGEYIFPVEMLQTWLASQLQSTLRKHNKSVLICLVFVQRNRTSSVIIEPCCNQDELCMPKVLLVDDDEKLLVAVGDFLEHQRFIVDTAASGTDAKEKLQVFSYDLLVIDWNIPEPSGLDLCRWFRGRGGNTPILMLTGRSMIDDKESGFEAGVDDYLTKPFELRELAARLKALTRRGGSVAPSRILSLCGVVVEPEAFKAKLDGKDFPLTPKEFEILEFLMRHHDQVFSIEALLDRLWKDGAEVSTDTVRVYIRRLREKFEKCGRGSLIKNVHSVGYKFSTDES